VATGQLPAFLGTNLTKSNLVSSDDMYAKMMEKLQQFYALFKSFKQDKQFISFRAILEWINGFQAELLLD